VNIARDAAHILEGNQPAIDGRPLGVGRKGQRRLRGREMVAAEIEDKVGLLNCGADDYLTKPFAFEELLARIRAQLRKKDGLLVNKLTVADLTLDLQTHEVTRAGQEVLLTTRELALLEYLMRNTGRVLSRSMIIEHVWDINYKTDTNVIDVFINHLRKKIEPTSGARRFIFTEPGVGFRFASAEDEASAGVGTGAR